MRIRTLAVLLTLVPFVAEGAARSDSARVGVNRVAAAGQRMPTMATKITGNKSVNTPSDSGDKNDSEEEDFVPDNGDGGAVDEGGGGTVAKYVANLGIDVVDLGVPVLSMHAPFEVVAKFDVYETYRTMYEFCK